MSEPKQRTSSTSRSPLRVVESDERQHQPVPATRSRSHPKIFYALIALATLAVPVVMVWSLLATEQRAEEREQMRQHRVALARKAFLHKSRPTYRRLTGLHSRARRKSVQLSNDARHARRFARSSFCPSSQRREVLAWARRSQRRARSLARRSSQLASRMNHLEARAIKLGLPQHKLRA